MTEQAFDPVPKAYGPERTELAILVLDNASQTELNQWLDTTLYRHRAQAYAHGLEDGKRKSAARWDRLVPMVPLALLLLAVLVWRLA